MTILPWIIVALALIGAAICIGIGIGAHLWAKSAPELDRDDLTTDQHVDILV